LLWYVSFSFAYMPLMTMQYDLRAALYVDEEQLAREREAIAREIHSLLMKWFALVFCPSPSTLADLVTSIPVEDLASNGESVRGKVFHIACALCAQVPGNDSDQELIRDWCNMVRCITFQSVGYWQQRAVFGDQFRADAASATGNRGVG